MPGDFHIHRALMHLLLIAAVGANGPDAVYLVPRTFVAIHDEAGVGGRETGHG